MSRLPFDYYRCTTKRNSDGETNPLCKQCLRHTSPGNPLGQSMSTPPLFLDGKCPDRILEYGK